MTLDKLIIGATFAAFGAAGTSGGTVIADNSQLGYEFVYSYRRADMSVADPKSEAAKKFCALYKQGSEGKGLILGTACVALGKLIKKEALSYMFLQQFIGLEFADGLYAASFIGANGITKIKAKTVIDTTPECVSAAVPASAYEYKRLNAIDEHLNVVGTYLNIADDWKTAREKLSSAIAAHKGGRILRISSRFEYKPKVSVIEIGEGHIWMPSSYHANPVAAIDCGAGII